MGDPIHTHAWEQFMAATTELAAAMGRYKKRLEEAGFTSAEALVLVASLQAELMRKNR